MKRTEIEALINTFGEANLARGRVRQVEEIAAAAAAIDRALDSLFPPPARSIRLEIPGEICTEHRPRFGSGNAYKSTRYGKYLELVLWTGRAALAGIRDWPLDARYEVTITMHEHDARSRDWDNVKAICDGLKGVLWADDRQIDRAHVIRGEIRRLAPCVIVEASLLAPRAPQDAPKRPKGYRRPSGPLRGL